MAARVWRARHKRVRPEREHHGQGKSQSPQRIGEEKVSLRKMNQQLTDGPLRKCRSRFRSNANFSSNLAKFRSHFSVNFSENPPSIYDLHFRENHLLLPIFAKNFAKNILIFCNKHSKFFQAAARICFSLTHIFSLKNSGK
jgi:hypothetical protein